MKKVICLSLIGLTGCTTVYMPNGDRYQTVPSQHVVLNNTGYVLDVSADGQRIATLHTGQSISVAPHWLVPKTVITVVAHDVKGQYIGSDNWTFLSASPEVWQVNEVLRPRESR